MGWPKGKKRKPVAAEGAMEQPIRSEDLSHFLPEKRQTTMRLTDPWGRVVYLRPESVVAVEDMGENKLTENVYFYTIVTAWVGFGGKGELRLKVREKAADVAAMAGML